MPPFLDLIIKAGLLGSQYELPLLSNVLLVPPLGKDEASGSSLIKDFPEK